MEIKIRGAEPHDLRVIIELFKDCVLETCKTDYSHEELDAWSSASSNVERWREKIQNQFFIVALANETIVGFGSLESNDLIDLLYVHKDFQRRGVASRLIDHLTAKAKSCDTKLLQAEVSKTARKFFEAMGFRVVKEQSKQILGIFLKTYQMTKEL